MDFSEFLNFSATPGCDYEVIAPTKPSIGNINQPLNDSKIFEMGLAADKIIQETSNSNLVNKMEESNTNSARNQLSSSRNEMLSSFGCNSSDSSSNVIQMLSSSSKGNTKFNANQSNLKKTEKKSKKANNSLRHSCNVHSEISNFSDYYPYPKVSQSHLTDMTENTMILLHVLNLPFELSSSYDRVGEAMICGIVDRARNRLNALLQLHPESVVIRLALNALPHVESIRVGVRDCGRKPVLTVDLSTCATNCLHLCVLLLSSLIRLTIILFDRFGVYLARISDDVIINIKPFDIAFIQNGSSPEKLDEIMASFIVYVFSGEKTTKNNKSIADYCVQLSASPQRTRHEQTDGLPCMPMRLKHIEVPNPAPHVAKFSLNDYLVKLGVPDVQCMCLSMNPCIINTTAQAAVERQHKTPLIKPSQMTNSTPVNLSLPTAGKQYIGQRVTHLSPSLKIGSLSTPETSSALLTNIPQIGGLDSMLNTSSPLIHALPPSFSTVHVHANTSFLPSPRIISSNFLSQESFFPSSFDVPPCNQMFENLPLSSQQLNQHQMINMPMTSVNINALSAPFFLLPTIPFQSSKVSPQAYFNPLPLVVLMPEKYVLSDQYNNSNLSL